MATLQELEALFSQQSETLATEFKAWLDLSIPQGRAPLAKAAIALANHGGGTIVVGMREAANKPIGSHPRPEEIARYTADAVNAAINKYADPHVHCDVVHLNHPVTGHEHAFVVVPGGQTVPVMSVKDADGVIMSQRVYIRKPGPKSEEPFNSEEWRPLLSRCINNGRDEMLDRIRVIMSGSALTPVTEPNKLMEFIDNSRARFAQLVKTLPEKAEERHWIGSYEFAFQLQGVPTVTLPELNRLLERASTVKHTGWGPFVNLTRPPIAPVPANGTIEAWLGNPNEGVSDPRHADFWRASPEGRLYQLRGYDEDYMRGAIPGCAIDITTPIWRLGEAMLYIARLSMEWAGDARVTIWAEYSGLEGRTLGAYTGTRNPMNSRISRTPKVILQGESSAKEIMDNTVEVLHPLLKPLYEVFEFYEIPERFIVEELAKLRAGNF